jgi:hypothetical protein
MCEPSTVSQPKQAALRSGSAWAGCTCGDVVPFRRLAADRQGSRTQCSGAFPPGAERAGRPVMRSYQPRARHSAGEQAPTGAIGGRRRRAVALLASVVSSLTSANGLGGARGQCSPVTRGGAPGVPPTGFTCLGGPSVGELCAVGRAVRRRLADCIHVAATVPAGLDRRGRFLAAVDLLRPGVHP